MKDLILFDEDRIYDDLQIKTDDELDEDKEDDEFRVFEASLLWYDKNDQTKKYYNPKLVKNYMQ